ncbi:MAG: hypothetical protein R3A78_13785 [Polyangiales bacterium]
MPLVLVVPPLLVVPLVVSLVDVAPALPDVPVDDVPPVPSVADD